jgi:uncharacterized protein involved in exopolysaccharide biosynthesis
MTHVLLENDAGGRDPVAAGYDMPTIATSTSVVSAVKDRLHLPGTISDIQSGITAHVPPRSSIMTIAYRSKDPAEAIAVPNAVAEEFVKFYAALPSKRSQAIVDAFADQLKAVRTQLTAVEQKLEAGSAGHVYVGSQASLDNLASQLALLRQQRGVAYAELVADQRDLSSDRTQPGRTAKIVRAEILQNDVHYRRLSQDVARDSSEFTTTRSGVTDAYPGIAGFADKVRKEESALATARDKALHSPDAFSPSAGGQVVATDKAASAVAGDQARVAALDAQIADLDTELRSSSQATNDSPGLGSLRAQRDTLETRYQTLATRFASAQANAAEQNSLGEAVIIDRAIKADPNIVGPPLILSIGALLVLLGTIGVAYLAEMIDPKLISPIDVESLYGTPSLASLRNQ